MKQYGCKALILLSTAYAMFRMAHWALGFTYFTQLSNLYVAAAVVFQLVKPGKTAYLLKFTAAVSIIITFLVYLLVLAPMVPGGMIAAYRQDHWASLCLHLITPALTVTDFLVIDSRQWTGGKRDAFLALIPPMAYFVFILILHQCGMQWMGMAAPYSFLNYSAPAGWFGWRPDTVGPTSLGVGVFYVMLLLLGIFLLVGRGLLKASERMR